MSLYNVMLVDDEEDVIQAIMKKIDWESLGFTVCGYAHNGLEALDLAEQTTPDVVMTDIKMPYMDGLELARAMKEQYPMVKILIFSGFDEFEYAQEAIRLEAEEYILKPIDAEELGRVFSRIREGLDRELDEKRSAEKLQAYYLESLPLLRENFYISLIEGNIPPEDVGRYITDYQIDLTGPLYAVTVLHLSAPEAGSSGAAAPAAGPGASAGISDGRAAVSPLLRSVSVRRYAQERLGTELGGRFFTYLGHTVGILQLPSEEEYQTLTDRMDRFCRLAGHMADTVVTAGIGILCRDLSELPLSYSGARDAVSYRVLYGRGKAINITEIAPGERSVPVADGGAGLHNVFKKIKMDSREALGRAVEEFIRRRISPLTSIEEYHFAVMEMVSDLFRFAVGNRIDGRAVLGDSVELFGRLQQMDAGQLTEWLTGVCAAMQDSILRERSDSSRTLADRAVEYVRDNYADQDLTIDRICSALGVSAAYFSTIFKKETGKTFIAYLTDYRMARAVELLTEGNEKTYVVAGLVGYADPGYFSYVFKRAFGVSPSRYRTERQA